MATTTVHGFAIPTQCPTAQVLATWGTPLLVAAGTIHPLALTVLEEKRAKEAARDAATAEREAARAAKGSTPPVADTTPQRPPAAVGGTTPDTMPMDALVALCAANGCTGKLTGLSRWELVDKLEKATAPTPPATGPGKAKAQEDRTPVKAPAPGSVDHSKANTPPITTTRRTTLDTATVAQLLAALVATATTVSAFEALATAFDVAMEAAIDLAMAKATPPVNLSAPAPKVDAPVAPMAMAAQKVEAPKAATAPKPTCNAPKADGKPCKGTVLIGTTGHCKSHQTPVTPATLKMPAPKADIDPVVPGVFDANGKPMTLSAVWACLEAATAKTAA